MSAVQDVVARVQEHGHKVHRYSHGLLVVNAYRQEDADFLYGLGFQTFPYQPEKFTNPDRIAWECTVHESKYAEEEAVT